MSSKEPIEDLFQSQIRNSYQQYILSHKSSHLSKGICFEKQQEYFLKRSHSPLIIIQNKQQVCFLNSFPQLVSKATDL